MTFEFKKMWRSHWLLVLFGITFVFTIGNFYLQQQRQTEQQQLLSQKVTQELEQLVNIQLSLRRQKQLTPAQQQLFERTYPSLITQQTALKTGHGQQFIQAEQQKRQWYTQLNHSFQKNQQGFSVQTRLPYSASILATIAQQQAIFDDLQVTTAAWGLWFNFSQHFFHPIVLLLLSILVAAIFSSELTSNQYRFMVMTTAGGWQYVRTSYFSALTCFGGIYGLGSLLSCLIGQLFGGGLFKNSTNSWRMPVNATSNQQINLGQSLVLTWLLGSCLAVSILLVLFTVLLFSKQLIFSFASAALVASIALSLSYLLPNEFQLTGYLNLFTQLPQLNTALISSLSSLLLLDLGLIWGQHHYQKKWSVA